MATQYRPEKEKPYFKRRTPQANSPKVKRGNSFMGKKLRMDFYF